MVRLFSRKLFRHHCRQVFWLAPLLTNLPASKMIKAVVLKDQKRGELTAAGTAPDLHRIPF